jgi:hypothetical protein
MISAWEREQISGLLRSGQLSKRGIARERGVSVDTVCRIAEEIPEQSEPEPPEWFVPEGATKGRCQKCHASVYLPCVACRLKERLGIS